MSAAAQPITLPPNDYFSVEMWAQSQYGDVIAKLEKGGYSHIDRNVAPAVTKPARRRKSRQNLTQVVTTTPVRIPFEAPNIQRNTHEVGLFQNDRKWSRKGPGRRSNGRKHQQGWRAVASPRHEERHATIRHFRETPQLVIDQWEREFERL
ncbi:hypothetical protein KC872_01445 [Candidatus Kaiserbacteria bacterium]|nr:hypothetical protein [Candidatus Kaiserbacteria bacterium]